MITENLFVKFKNVVVYFIFSFFVCCVGVGAGLHLGAGFLLVNPLRLIFQPNWALAPPVK